MPHVDTPQSVCRLGLARADITPPVGIYHRMWGAATHDRASGVHRPLTATGLVLQAAGAESLATEAMGTRYSTTCVATSVARGTSRCLGAAERWRSRQRRGDELSALT